MEERKTLQKAAAVMGNLVPIGDEIFNFFQENESSFDIIPVYMSIIKQGIEINTYDISNVHWKDLGIPENL